MVFIRFGPLIEMLPVRVFLLCRRVCVFNFVKCEGVYAFS